MDRRRHKKRQRDAEERGIQRDSAKRSVWRVERDDKKSNSGERDIFEGGR